MKNTAVIGSPDKQDGAKQDDDGRQDVPVGQVKDKRRLFGRRNDIRCRKSDGGIGGKKVVARIAQADPAAAKRGMVWGRVREPQQACAVAVELGVFLLWAAAA